MTRPGLQDDLLLNRQIVVVSRMMRMTMGTSVLFSFGVCGLLSDPTGRFSFVSGFLVCQVLVVVDVSDIVCGRVWTFC